MRSFFWVGFFLSLIQLVAVATEGQENWNQFRGPSGDGKTLAKTRPLFEHGHVYLTTGVSGHLLAVRPSGTGDVTDTHVSWSAGRGPSISSPTIVDDLLFRVSDKGGIVSCLEARTGREVWKGRLGGNHWVSPLYGDGKIYFFSKEGKVSLISAGRKFHLLAENRFDKSFIASPAIAGDAMILRSLTHLYYVAGSS